MLLRAYDLKYSGRAKGHFFLGLLWATGEGDTEWNRIHLARSHVITNVEDVIAAVTADHSAFEISQGGPAPRCSRYSGSSPNRPSSAMAKSRCPRSASSQDPAHHPRQNVRDRLPRAAEAGPVRAQAAGAAYVRQDERRRREAEEQERARREWEAAVSVASIRAVDAVRGERFGTALEQWRAAGEIKVFCAALDEAAATIRRRLRRRKTAGAVGLGEGGGGRGLAGHNFHAEPTGDQ